MRTEDLELMISLLRPKTVAAEDEGRRRQLDRIPTLASWQQHYERRRAKRDAVAAAIIRLAPENWADTDDRLRAALEGHGVRAAAEPEGLSIDRPACAILDRLALDALDTAHVREAALLFAVKLSLSTAPLDQADALCSIAHCALRMGEFADALALARAALGLHPANPRAHCIAGLCQLQSGQRKAAQGSLALAARIARTNRDYIELLQAAQRLLLILHLDG